MSEVVAPVVMRHEGYMTQHNDGVRKLETVRCPTSVQPLKKDVGRKDRHTRSRELREEERRLDDITRCV